MGRQFIVRSPSVGGRVRPVRLPLGLRRRGRRLRRVLRVGYGRFSAARASLGAVRHHGPAGDTRPHRLDHGYLVRTVLAEHADHHRHSAQLYDAVTRALIDAGARFAPVVVDRREPPLIDVSGDIAQIWAALAELDSDRLALTVQVARSSTAAIEAHRVGRRWLTAAAGAEYVESAARPARWSAPISLLGRVPPATEWLLASHETSRDGSRHLGFDTPLRLRFVPAARITEALARGAPAGRGGEATRAKLESCGRVPIGFPIDAVFTWVDFDDPAWQRSFAETARPPNLVRAAANESRFNHVNELRYSLRSVSEFAPWINHLWLVTAGQVPGWLDTSRPEVADKITVVSHDQLWRGEPGLPTFNSQAIEAALHRIPGLAEHFLYFNDDMLIGGPVEPGTFFTPDGTPKAFISSSRVPDGEPSPRDLAPDAAGKNNRRLVAKATGQLRSAKYQHAPYALRRSVIDQLEEKFGAELATTRRSQFRSTSDVTAAGGLHHSYALATGQAVPGEIRYRYVDLESPDADHLLDGIARYRYFESFCVNVVVRGPRDPAGLVRFLQNYYPNPAPWETCGEG